MDSLLLSYLGIPIKGITYIQYILSTSAATRLCKGKNLAFLPFSSSCLSALLSPSHKSSLLKGQFGKLHEANEESEA